jgi:hypothetical protein
MPTKTDLQHRRRDKSPGLAATREYLEAAAWIEEARASRETGEIPAARADRTVRAAEATMADALNRGADPSRAGRYAAGLCWHQHDPDSTCQGCDDGATTGLQQCR